MILPETNLTERYHPHSNDRQRFIPTAVVPKFRSDFILKAIKCGRKLVMGITSEFIK